MTRIYGAVIAVLMICNVMKYYFIPVRFNQMICLPVCLMALLVIGFSFRTKKKSGKLRRRPEDPDDTGRKNSTSGFLPYCLSHPIAVMMMIMLAVFILQTVLVHFTWHNHGWDVQVVMAKMTGEIKENALDWYMRTHQNNVLICGLLTWMVEPLASLFGLNPWHAASILSMAAVDLSIILASLGAFCFYRRKGLYTVLLFLIAFIAFQPQNMIPYTDTFGMLCASVLLYCIALLLTCHEPGALILSSLFFGMFIVTGYYMKPTVIIAGIAFAIAWLIGVPAKKIAKKVLQALLISLLCMSAGGFAGKTVHDAAELTVLGCHPTATERDRDEYVMIHCFAMGLFEDEEAGFYGGFHSEDDKLTSSTQWREKKTEAARKLIDERLSRMGLTGFLKHIWNKMVWVSVDGNFFYKAKGRNLQEETAPSWMEKLLSGWNNSDSAFYKTVAANWFEGLWPAVMIGIGCSILPGRRVKKQDQGGSPRAVFGNTLRLSVIGMILFMILFEARARYLYLYAPYFSLLGLYGLYQAVCLLRSRHSHPMTEEKTMQ